jgi:Domain of unknown function (DUF4224)
MFLTAEELRELTGFARSANQLQWLRENGWKFAEDAQRRPKVARSYFELRLGSVTAVDFRAEPTAAVVPRFDALRALAKQGARHGA